MKYLFILFFTLLNVTSLIAQDENLRDSDVAKYINKYKATAIAEQVRVGVPAAITLAQGIHESSSGLSPLAVEANNHFGIKCKKDWKGETMLHDDDAEQECFRKYPTAFDSYTDHSNFLKNNRRYGFLFDIDALNYKDWAVGLRKAGYATNPNYSARLTTLIEKYSLQQYTQAAVIEIANNAKKNAEIIPENDKPTTIKNVVTKLGSEVVGFAKEGSNAEPLVEKLNGLKGFYAKKGTMLLDESVSRNIRYQKLLEINDLDDEPLQNDMFVYLEKKYKKSPNRKSHTVLEGEDMLLISQKEGVQLRSLLALNLLKINDMPAVGQRVYLQDEVSRTPQLVGEAPKAKPVITTNIEPEIAVEKKTEIINVPEKIAEPITNIAEKVLLTKGDEINKITAPETKIVEEEKLVVAEPVAKNLNPIKEVSELSLEEFQQQQAEMANAANSKIATPENNVKPSINTTLIVPKKVNKNAPIVKETTIIIPPKVEPVLVVNASPIIEKEVVILPAPKSPSTYNEPGLSPEIRRLKKVMDEIVYAAPLPAKPKKIIVVPAPLKPSGASKPTTTTLTTKPLSGNNTPVVKPGTSAATSTNKIIVAPIKPPVKPETTATKPVVKLTPQQLVIAKAVKEAAEAKKTKEASVKKESSKILETPAASIKKIDAKPAAKKMEGKNVTTKKEVEKKTVSKVKTEKAKETNKKPVVAKPKK
jgi:Mannosyl-glycoprotein endo-beta-N-acetylglucosaminidase